MKTSRKGIDFIKSFEGLCRTAYRLPGETYYTIGYGHYGADVKPGQEVTVQQAEALLARDLVRFEGWVAQYTSFPLNQNQFDALVSFCYNCGPGNLRQLVEGRDAATVAEKLLLYTGSSSEAYRAGLTRRRKAERELFLTPDERELDMTKEELLKVEGTGDKPSDWAAAATSWAKGAGVFNGDGAGNYGWQQPITREAVAVILYEFARKNGLT